MLNLNLTKKTLTYFYWLYTDPSHGRLMEGRDRFVCLWNSVFQGIRKSRRTCACMKCKIVKCLCHCFSGYRSRPRIKFTIKRGNDGNAFEIINHSYGKSFVRNRKILRGPKTYSLEYHGEVIYQGQVTATFISNLNVYVSRYDFWFLKTVIEDLHKPTFYGKKDCISIVRDGLMCTHKIYVEHKKYWCLVYK